MLTRTLILAFTIFLAAVGADRARAESGPAKPQPPVAPHAAPLPPDAQPATSAKGQDSQPLPSTPAERAKLLSNLYAYLATAETEADSKPIAAAIEKLWLYNGSDTIGVLMDRAAQRIAAKDYDSALKFMDAVVDLAPDYAEGWNRRAYVHYLNNDIERMVGDLRRCLALEPNHFRALEGLAQVMRETGQKKAALKAYEKLLEINPNSSGAKDAVKELSGEVEGQKT